MTYLTNQPATGRASTSEARTRRRLLSGSFSRGAQTMEEATVSARAMAGAMERQGTLLRAPVRR